MSRLSIITQDQAVATVETLYKDLERRIAASPPGLCPIDLASSFLKLCHAQTCGKCVPCRIGLGQLENLLEDVMDGKGTPETLELIKKTARTIYNSADCAIGYEAARMVLKGTEGFRDDYEEHINHDRCLSTLDQPVPCVSLCPAGVDVPGYVALIHQERYGEAVQLIRKDNPFPTACALICEHPCETRCRRNMIDDAVNIRGLKRYAVEHAGDIPPEVPGPATGMKVAIVGGGPSGLSAAYYLALMGHEVTIYEQHTKLGGMLRYGIPSYRLPRELLDQEIQWILETGIQVQTGITVGKDISVVELKDQFDAVYLAIGAHIDKKIELENQVTEGVFPAVELLRRIGDDDYPDLTGLTVVVIGGGNVAMDVARTSIRLGASRVSVVYRRRSDDMTAMEDEITDALEEGIEIYDLSAPVRIEADAEGKIQALWAEPQIIWNIRQGRPTPKKALQEAVRIECDLLITATGQGIESRDFEEQGIPVTKGVIDALSSGGVSDIPGVYAGGDCVTGPATVIRAIAAGKVAAANIDEYLGYHHVIRSDIQIPTPRLADKIPRGRVNLKGRKSSQRLGDFELVEIGMTREEALQESRRCLRCDQFGFGVFKGGRVREW